MLVYVGYEINTVITEIRPLVKERESGKSLVSDIASEIVNLRYSIHDVVVTVDQAKAEIESIDQNITPLIHEIESVRRDMPVLIDRTEKLMVTDVPDLLLRAEQLIADIEKAGERAGKGAVKGAVKGTIGLPVNTGIGILSSPAKIFKKKENSDQKMK
ncbi:vacuolar protein sorting-associated protein [Candidatus Scalindua japonica]|uniref:Vacuolar protein sorting-associated protein n=1 Tax=Candidatus Scalindua japonica TaxID=1284222 RepID=A0A286U4G7_9BACT|nr:vacuolar protein sorting-associated protein [Candidatus Scalindua japonica]